MYVELYSEISGVSGASGASEEAIHSEHSGQMMPHSLTVGWFHDDARGRF